MYRRKKWQRELRKHKKKEAGAVVYAAVPFCLFYTVCTLVWYKGSFMGFLEKFAVSGRTRTDVPAGLEFPLLPITC